MALKSSSAFESAYAALNSQQKIAVDTLEGPVMVLAGPGTGKTQILAARIANILRKTDTNPYNILALTFTESAAKNMRERLIQLIGPTAYAVHVQTFHAFCEEVIRSYPEFFPINRESQVLSDLERYELMEELLQSPRLKALRTVNSPFHYLKAVIKAISDLKREGVTVKKFDILVAAEEAKFETQKADLRKTELLRRQRALEKQKELALIYTQYQEELQKRLRYDYDDMITLVTEAFQKEESLLLDYQEKLTYFLVDEYQDTNTVQNTVVDLLASFWGERANIFVVGDPHQSIYRFQGASLENTMNFIERYSTATVITLETGYRCPQAVYDVAAEIIHSESGPLHSIHSDGEKVQVYKAATSPLETIFIAEEIQSLIKKGVKPSEVAVLYRNNADAVELQTALSKWQIPYAVDGGNDVLHSEVVLQFLTLCKVIADIGTATEGHELFEVMSYPWLHLDHAVVIAVARAAGKTNMSLFERITKGYVNLSKLQFCEQITAIDFAIIEDFMNKLQVWVQQDAELPFPLWFETILTESGFLDWVLAQPEKILFLHQINALFREVKNFAQQDHQMNLQRFLQRIEVMRQHGIQIASEEVKQSEETVTLSTVHKAKGQEWEYVFLAKCIDGKWGNTRMPTELPLPEGILQHQHQDVTREDRDDDDRRLFYVALTRAKKRFTVSYPEAVIGSMFIEEIPENLKVIVNKPELQDNSDEHLQKLLQPAPPRLVGQSEEVFFKKVVSDFSLSVSSLNTYLRSPEDFVENVLLKVPRAKEPFMAFGTAVHTALEKMFRSFEENKKYPDADLVLDTFEAALKREVLAENEFELRLEYGRQMLSQYIQHYAYDMKEVPHPVFIERFFGGNWSKAMLGDISLTGRVDRIDLIDAEKKLGRVIDYKTGRARTINEIEGKVATAEFSERELQLPENIRGPYKRQLLFYKLLTHLDHTFPLTITEGMFDFVEPDRDGKFVRRHFALLDEDVETLKELIQEVISEIRDLRFLV